MRLVRVHALLAALLVSAGCTEVDGAGALGSGIDASGQAGAGQAWAVDDIDPGSDRSGDGQGDFEDPCTENDDCVSGYCIEGPEGDICTKLCGDQCPEGYRCRGVLDQGSDPVFLCVPSFVQHCRPCMTDNQCVEGTCRELDGTRHCIGSCSAMEDCPEGFACVLSDGQGSCLPKTGSCTCYLGMDLGQRTCSTSSGLGECFGVETCNPEGGWSDCTASLPSDETCDYSDDDCDGQVDEGYRSDAGLYLEVQHCGGCGLDCTKGFPSALETACVLEGGEARCQVLSCAPGFVLLNEYQCVPEGASLCQPCDDATACLGLGAACLEQDDGRFCGQACGEGSPCPDGYECSETPSDGLQCVPLTGACSCSANNEGLSRACTVSWIGVNPGEVSYSCPGTEACGEQGWGECVLPDDSCDGQDNDCDGQIDEAYRDADGLYDTVEHCGGCEQSCAAILSSESNAVATCDVSTGFPTCSYACEGAYVDVDGIVDNGCECAPQGGADLPDADGPGGVGVDSDCDGVDGDKDAAIFVSKTGDDGSPGTLDLPKRTLAAALDAAAQNGLRHVYVATGAYVESVRLIAGVKLFGGYSADFRVRDSVAYETALIGVAATVERPATVSAVSVGTTSDDAVGLDGFVIFGNQSSIAGSSSYAVWLRDCGGYTTITNNEIYAADGAPGSAGDAGSSGPNGGAGQGGVPAVLLGSQQCTAAQHDVGGQGGASACGAFGGKGGARTCPDAPGDIWNSAQSLPTESFGDNGTGQGGGGGEPGYHSAVGASDCYVCSSNYNNSSAGGDGASGSAGVDGSSGAACVAGGDVSSSGFWAPHEGMPGTDGLSGGGGGGGGAGGGIDVFSCAGISLVTGGAGGGGGGGGCGGVGGSPGQPGGGSFGFFVSWSGSAPSSKPNLSGNTIHMGSGGAGGAGGGGGLAGAGGPGGAGGASGQGEGDWPINICGQGGGYGGQGGDGGHGGGGAGGCGGVSYGLFVYAMSGAISPGTWSTNSYIDSGSPGSAGAGGVSYGADGLDGQPGIYADTNL